MPLEAEAHPRAKLTRALVCAARVQARDGATVETLATEAGVSWSTMYRAVVGESWQSVDAEEAPVPIKRRRWTPADLEQLAALDNERAPYAAKQIGRSPAAVNIVRSRRGL